MVDLNNLKLKEDVDVGVDTEHYVDPSDFPPPPPEGKYTFIQGKPTFEATNEGYLSASMDQVIELPEEYKGGRIGFDRISNKPFERQGVKVNMMTDHLRALGVTERCTTHVEYATAIEAAEGKPFTAQVGWEGYCGHKGTEFEVAKGDYKNAFTIKGEKNFPPNGNGGHLSTIVCPKCGQEVQARAKITRRIPATL